MVAPPARQNIIWQKVGRVKRPWMEDGKANNENTECVIFINMLPSNKKSSILIISSPKGWQVKNPKDNAAFSQENV